MANATPQQLQSAEALFNQNYPAIQAAKQQTGDWEKAFQQVTGQPWPSGQHVVIDEGGGHAVKDEGFWKKAAEIAATAAPIVAAPFTGGSTLALIGAGSGAAKGLLNGQGLKGALIDAGLGLASSAGGKMLDNVVSKGLSNITGNSVAEGVTQAMGDYGPDFVGPTLEQAGKTAGKGILSRVGDILTNGKTSDILSAAGQSIGAAADAAGKNRMAEADMNIKGQDAYERELMARSADEQKQRNTALDNVYRQSWYANRQTSPYDPRPVTPLSADMQSALDALATQGKTKLANGAQYDSNSVAPLAPYTPTKKGVLEEVGTWASPILTGVGNVGKILKQ